jgi:trigger factor
VTIRTAEVGEAAAAPFIGAKKGDIVSIDLKALYGESMEDIAKGLNTSVEALGEDFPTTQTFTVNRLLRVGKAPLDQTLFDKVLGPGAVDNEEDFRMAFRSAIADQADKASEQRLLNDILSATLGQNEIYLPEDWVVRTIIEGAKEDEKPSEEDVRKYYHERHANEMRVSFVTTRILEQAEASITGDDVRERVAQDVRQTYMQYGMAEPDENAVQKATQSYLEKDENAQNVFRSLERERLASLLLNAAEVTVQMVSLAEFRRVDQAGQQNQIDQAGQQNQPDQMVNQADQAETIPAD